MRPYICTLLFLFLLLSSFAKEEGASVTEYKHTDVVIIAERDHRDVTQYDFICRLLADKRFAEKLEHVYTELGVQNMTSSANSLVTADWPDDNAFNEAMKVHLGNEDYDYNAGELSTDNLEALCRYYCNVRTFSIHNDDLKERMTRQMNKGLK